MVVIVLFLIAVFLAAAEASLLRVPRVRAAVQADQGDRGAARVLDCLDDLPRVMNTVLLVVLLVQIGAATITGVLAERNFGSLGITLTSIALTLVLFVYAEAIPKTFAVRQPMRVSKMVAGPVWGLSRLLRPLVSLLVSFADLQVPGRGIAGPIGVSEEELRHLAAEAASTGAIDESDVELMERAFELGDTRVDDIQVPRIDIVGIPSGSSVGEALDTAVSSGHRRLPVYQDNLDRIIGVVRLRDLAKAIAAGSADEVDSVMRPVLFVPESKRVIRLLREMQDAAQHFAVAVDEHGGTAGIVTIEDVVAELVGEVSDEGQVPVPPIHEIAPGIWSVDAGADVDDVESQLGVSFPRGDWRTVGGLVTDLAGTIPRVGDVVTSSGYRFEVKEATRRRVERLEVRPTGEAADDAGPTAI
jgi:CBS domain containing-hemolysin-like protein